MTRIAANPLRNFLSGRNRGQEKQDCLEPGCHRKRNMRGIP